MTKQQQANELEKKIRSAINSGTVGLRSMSYGTNRGGGPPCGCALFVAAVATTGVDPSDIVPIELYAPVSQNDLRSWLELEDFDSDDIDQLEMGFENFNNVYDDRGLSKPASHNNPFYRLGKRLQALAI